MSDEIRDVTTITFFGPRFEDAGLEFDVLSELLAYRRLLVETAKELWRSENPKRQRLPKGFEESIRLKLYSIVPESAVVPVKRVVTRDDSLLVHPPQRTDAIDDAAQLIDETIGAVSEDRPIPERMPKSVLPLLAAMGETLREGEAITTRAMRSAKAAELTCHTRGRLERLLEREVRSGDIDQRHFAIRDGVSVDELERHVAADENEYDDSAPPLWEAVVRVGASLPPEEWERVPTDLAANLEHYLYGSSGDDE